MKNYYFLLLLLLPVLVFTSFAQQIGVPYRIGAKFGVGTTGGKMIIPAEYDILQPETYNDYRYFIGYKLVDKGNLSTLIYKNKIVLKDQNYSSYYINNELVKAIEYKLLNKPNRYDTNRHEEMVHLYDLKGKKIFQTDFKSISVIDDIDDTKKITAVLIYTLDANDFESLYMYDTKQKKITKIFIENAKPINANFNYTDDYRDRTITNIYKDKNGVGKEMILELKNNVIVVKSETDINFKAENQRNIDSDRYSDVMAIPDEKPKIIINSEEEKKILTVRKVERKGGFYYLPKKIEELKITNIKLKEEEQFVVSKKNKQGLFTVYNKTYVIPVTYDEIIYADFEGRNSGYILRNEDKYGLFIYSHNDNRTIVPIFDKIPLLENFNYFGEKIPLIKLYDEYGKLFCYADETGKLFYKK
ncbi:hypothetical protein [Flavobacterium sp.]